MEKHHKLRRPVGSSLHGCNICGKEGHQAAVCAVGTVDWANKWSKEAFIPDKPHNYGEPDYKALAVKAKEWAEERKKRKAEAAENGGDDADGAKKEKPDGDGAAPAAPVGVWQTFFDSFGRPYYFNAATNTTQWTPPVGMVPSAVPPPMPPPGMPAPAGAAAPGSAPPAPGADGDAAPAAPAEPAAEAAAAGGEEGGEQAAAPAAAADEGGDAAPEEGA